MSVFSFVLLLIFIVPLLGSPIPQSDGTPAVKLYEWKASGPCSLSLDSKTVELPDTSLSSEKQQKPISQCEITFEMENNGTGSKNIKIKYVRYISPAEVVAYYIVAFLCIIFILAFSFLVIVVGLIGLAYACKMCRSYKFQIVRKQ